ncbi:neuroserpin-like isoform X2 [Condylostylus longicornis]|uniref:neuroserpin-like isoform X2 n=1 Tax=Condylostylus longicornis TaxID=2530218 RepID=UPI00244DF1C0|nr:neuroserpin-like isoform X2 [Condylostylus longicornis]
MADYFRNHSKIAFKLFVAACDELSSRNIVISPLALQICLASIYISCSEDLNSKEMLKLLQLSKNTSIIELKDIFSALFQSKSDFFTYHIFNKFYIQNGKILNNDFIKNFFHEIKSEVNNIDFNNTNKQNNVEKINKECCKNTNERISQIVTANDFDETFNTVMTIINAASLSASWDASFYGARSKENFFNNNNESVEIAMMENTIPHFKYGEFDEHNIKIAEFRYAGYYENELAMLVILPIEENQNINELLIQLTEIDFFDICNKLQETTMWIKFPKFKMESKKGN